MSMPCRWVTHVQLRILYFKTQCLLLQHFGFQPEELADEFSQSTIELLISVLTAMQSKVGPSLCSGVFVCDLIFVLHLDYSWLVLFCDTAAGETTKHCEWGGGSLLQKTPGALHRESIIIWCNTIFLRTNFAHSWKECLARLGHIGLRMFLGASWNWLAFYEFLILLTRSWLIFWAQFKTCLMSWCGTTVLRSISGSHLMCCFQRMRPGMDEIRCSSWIYFSLPNPIIFIFQKELLSLR